EDWTERYRPKTLKEVVGNPRATQQLRDWALEWESGSPAKKAAVLIGTPGTGKTSAALALANDFGWVVVEMNASDHRNAEAINAVALRGAIADTFTSDGEFLSRKEGRLKLIILDEADNIFGREDRGGIPAIVELIRMTKQPVVLIVNDFYALSRKSSVIKSGTLQIRFNRIHNSTVKSVLRGIAKDKEVRASERVLDLIAQNSNGDLRSAVRDLQAVAEGKTTILEEETLVLGNRQVAKTMYDLLGEVLHGTNPSRARSIVMEVNETPEYVLLWLDENLPIEYRKPEDLERGFRFLARSDIFLGRVGRRQYFGLWSYASDLMSYGVNVAKESQYHEYARYRFPLYLMKMSRTRAMRGLKESVSSKLGTACHMSTSAVAENLLPYFNWLFRKDKDFRIAMAIRFDLDPEELAYLLNEKIDSHSVKHLISEVQRVQHVRSTEMTVPPIEEARSDEKEKEGEPEGPGSDSQQQRSLFEY
ncbi:MAG: replication factor C large subunit, partial [Methanomassiliicoccales archaeon]|nr:replication factor C large subunit [Methanomassiliicoccales archaeon]